MPSWFISELVASIDGFSIHWIQFLGAPALTAASCKISAAFFEHCCADGWKAKTIGFLVFKAINDLKITVNDYGVGIKDLKAALNHNYSSKKDSERAGMGFSIIRALSDDFSIRSEENIGTRVYIMKTIKHNYQKV